MSKALNQSQFGRAAGDYATSAVHAEGESLSRIVRLAQPQKTWRALDVATGAGHMAAAFAPHVADIVASDITVEMLAEAAMLADRRAIPNMTTAHAAADALPFDDRHFDLVCCRLAAHHFPDLAGFVYEAARVLKPGGTFALVDNVGPDGETMPGFSHDDVEAALRDYNGFEKLRDPSHAHAPQSAQWMRLVRAAGLEVAAREQMTKEMEFAPWVARMRCDAPTVAALEALLTTGPKALRHFLKPRRDTAGALHLSLQEMLLVAKKPI